MTKICKICKEDLPLEECFYTREPHRRGYFAECKWCLRRRNLTDNHRKQSKEWRMRNPDKAREATKNWRAANKGATAAQSLVWYYLNNPALVWPANCLSCGEEWKTMQRNDKSVRLPNCVHCGTEDKPEVRYRLERPENCQNCGSECKPDAHHEDYDKPLDVIWLCVRCHGLTKHKI